MWFVKIVRDFNYKKKSLQHLIQENLKVFRELKETHLKLLFLYFITV